MYCTGPLRLLFIVPQALYSYIDPADKQQTSEKHFILIGSFIENIISPSGMSFSPKAEREEKSKNKRKKLN